MKFGEQLKTERNKLSLTQEAVATELYVSRQTISSWETGRTYPDIDSLIALSNLYQISLDRLLKEDNGMVEDIRRKTALKENGLVFAASMIVNLLLLALTVMSANKVNGFKMETGMAMVIAFITLGNVIVLLHATKKYMELSPKWGESKQKSSTNWLVLICLVLSSLLLVASQLPFLIPAQHKYTVIGLASGIIVAAILIVIGKKHTKKD